MKATRKMGLAGVSDEQVLKDLRRVARKLKAHRLAQADYRRHGRYSWQQVNRRFGSWGKALQRVGLRVSVDSGMHEDELFYNVMAVWAKLGQKPKTEDMRRPLSKFSIKPYVDRFGTWRRPQGRQRFQVMLRDKFRCRLCGRSPSTHPGVTLRIDHVIPWSKGGKTIDSNLQTLCDDCNQGKSDRRQE